MRLVRTFVFLLAFSSLGAAQSLTNCTSANTTGASTITTVAFGTVTVNDAIVVFTSGIGASSTATITDNSGSGLSWVQVGSYYYSTDRGGMFVVKAITSAYSGATITSTWTFGGQATIVACEISGAITGTGLVDTSTGSAANGVTSMTSPSFTTSNANDLLVYCTGNPSSGMGTAAAGLIGSVTATIPTGATGSNRSACEYVLATSIQTGITAAMSWANSTTHQIAIAGAFEVNLASANKTMMPVVY